MCSWRPVERVKTIDLRCLQKDMEGACRADIIAAHGVPIPFQRWIWNESLPIFLKSSPKEEKVLSTGCSRFS